MDSGSAPEGAAAAGGAAHTFACLGSASHVDARLATDITNFNKLNDEQTKALVSSVVSFLQSPQAHDVAGDAEELARSQGLPPQQVKGAARGLLVILRGAVRHSVGKERLVQELQLMGLSAAHAKRVGSAWGVTAASLTEVASAGTFLMNELVDMQWKFIVSASSSEVDRIGSPAVQLSLVLDVGGGTHSTVVVELTLPQFYDFLADMEKAQAYVQTLSASG